MLDQNNNKIECEGTKTVANGLKNNKAVTQLDINNIEDEGEK